MLQALVIIFLAAVLAPTIYRAAGRFTGWILAIFPAAFFIYLLSFLQPVIDGETFILQNEWVPSLGVGLHFFVDGLSLFFAMLISAFGFFIILYASGYLKGDPYIGRFYLYLVLFMASMLGLVLAGDIIALFVFWELTSLSSYLLIGYKNKYLSSRNSALQALLTTVLGGLALLGGLILMGNIADTYLLHEILNQGDAFINHGHYIFILVLVLLGCFTKSAQVPFHYWLPNAMEAPTPVSAYLHSATMVKVGLFFLARFSPALGGTPEWQYALTIVGGATMFTGAFLAFQQSDLKKILAYTTISALGVITMLLGVGTEIAMKAAIVFLAAHAFYKATLFLVAGSVDHETGTRNINEVGQLGGKMPLTATASILASLSMAGVPPLFGFIGKEKFYEGALSMPDLGVVLVALSVLSSAFFVVVALLLGYQMLFSGNPEGMPKKPHEAPFVMWIGPVVLGIGGLVFGIFPILMDGLLNQAILAINPAGSPFELKLWHGFNIIFFLSIFTLIVGFIFYHFRDTILGVLNPYSGVSNYGPEKGYDQSILGLKEGARVQTEFFQNGQLRNYIMTSIGVFMALTVYSILFRSEMDFAIFGQASTINTFDILIAVMMFLGLLLIMITPSRLVTIVTLGVVGVGLALFFQFFGAPDLSMTQILVETLTVVLFVVILTRLPMFRSFSEKVVEYKQLTFSLAFGAVMTVTIWLITSQPMDPHFKQWYAENAVPLGKGRNIVNVILVDFRSMDTYGEAIVIGIAAVGVLGLLGLTLKEKNDKSL